MLAEVLRAPTRTTLRVLAFGAAVSVTLLFEGFRLGVDRQMATPAASLPATLVVIEAGAKHLVGLRSDLPQAARAEVERVPGVAAAHPLVSVPVIFVRRSRRTPIQLMAYDSAGAPRIGAGRGIAGPNEVVFDERLARVHGLGPGDRAGGGHAASRPGARRRSRGVDRDPRPRVEDVVDKVLWLEDGALRDRRQRGEVWSRDPVCRMRVDATNAPFFMEHGPDRRFVFCSRRCLDRFREDPARFTSAGASPG